MLNSPASTSEHPHPCVLHIGFAGSRVLFENAALSEDDQVQDRSRFESMLVTQLTAKIESLRARLQIPQNYFFNTISQLAIGGDSLFTRVCQANNYPQQIFLPQHWDEYLQAMDSDSLPDFSDVQRQEANELRMSNHILLSRVVSEASERDARFQEANLEILQHSDVVLCLLGENSGGGRSGGTLHLLEYALNRGLPVLELRLHVRQGLPKLSEIWHPPSSDYELPALPSSLPRCSASEMPAVVDAFSIQSRRSFKWHAQIIVGTHLLATILATLVLMFDNAHFGTFIAQDGLAVLVLLSVELTLLLFGLGTHLRFHHLSVSRQWAVGRLIWGILRAKDAARKIRAPLSFLNSEQFPRPFKPYLKTLNSLHLSQLREYANIHWLSARDSYLMERFTSPETGQMRYYQTIADKEERRLHISHGLFYFFAAVAIAATGLKLAKAWHALPVSDAFGAVLSGPLGLVAIVFPAMAVGALSLAASLDFEARVHTYKDILTFLTQQEKKLLKSQSEKEFNKLVMESESQLLNETILWFNRRVFSGIS